MKKLLEETGERLAALIGERVTLLCANYFYTGKLSGVNDECVLLTDKPCIVYETGPWSDDSWQDAQELPTDKHYVMKTAIESFGVLKQK